MFHQHKTFLYVTYTLWMILELTTFLDLISIFLVRGFLWLTEFLKQNKIISYPYQVTMVTTAKFPLLYSFVSLSVHIYELYTPVSVVFPPSWDLLNPELFSNTFLLPIPSLFSSVKNFHKQISSIWIVKKKSQGSLSTRG